MLSTTILAILPFALASAISPVLLTASVLSISSRQKSLQKSLAFLLGAAISIFAIGTLIVFFDHTVKTQAADPSTASDIIRLVLGILLILLAVRALLGKKGVSQRRQGTNTFEFFVLGLVLMLSNYSSIIMYFPAADIINRLSSSLSTKAAALAVMIGFTLLPAIVAPALLLILGKNASKVTIPMSHFVNKYSRFIMAALFGAIGALLLINSLRMLLQ